MIVFVRKKLERMLKVIAIHMRVRDRVRVNAWTHAKLLRQQVSQKRKPCRVMRTPEHHVIATHHVVQVETPADNVHYIGKRTWHVFLLGRSESVVIGIPRYHNALARRRLFLKMPHKLHQLISTEMMTPSVPVSRGDRAVFLGKVVPNLGELPQEPLRLFLSRHKPNLLRHEEFDGNLPKR